MQLLPFPAAKAQFRGSLSALLVLVSLLRTSTHALAENSVVGRDPNSDPSDLGHFDENNSAHLDEHYQAQLHLRRGLQQVGSDNILLRLFRYAMASLNLLDAPSCDPPNAAPPLPGKKGIGFTMRAGTENGSATVNIPKVQALSVSWNYSWGSERPAGQPEGVEFVPMIWGAYGDATNLAQRIAVVRADFDAGLTRRLLGFNEPDYSSQSNIPVERAISLWKQFEDSGMPLVSPSPAHSDREWMTTFMEQVDKNACLRMEWIGVHWYGGANAQGFKNYMTRLYSVHGSSRPLLITEFAPADWTTGGDPSRNQWTKEKVLEFAKEVLPWLEQQDFIAGYAWFPFNANSPQGHSSALFDANGELTTLGQYYASVTPDNIYGDQSIGTS